ncbi:MAG: glycoside hydrolase family 32 protein [Clostridiales bacterium]|jgi:beta-fructofuranosidase|nr:glycoside hydrolase family 32 protein [Clostridiales bacterium]
MERNAVDIEISGPLAKARIYEAEKSKLIPCGQKPGFHLCAPVGWINDPNGFSCYKGEYHLFYQYHPYSAQWGPMHWGHSKTKDFIRWDPLPAALAPDAEYDEMGCFSGSAVEYEGKHILLYTGVKKDESQAQCIAVGDGFNYAKSPLNPVIGARLLPAGSDETNFRDPKIWIDGDSFYAVAGSKSADGSGQIALFSCKNLEDWNFVGILCKNGNRYGKMWECPDFFHLDGQYVLLASPMDMLAEGLEFHGGHGSLCLIGQASLNECFFTIESSQAVDYGLDFYAPQTTQAQDGRRILIAWMQSWGNCTAPPEFEWSGMMTIPRELSIKRGKLFQAPVRELERYRQNEVIYKSISLDHSLLELDEIAGRQIDMTVETESGEYDAFTIFLAQNEKFHTSITYRRRENTLEFDRNFSGLRRDVICNRRIYVRNQNGRLKLRILLDKYCVEVFANDGEQVMTSLIYTEPEADGIQFAAEGAVVFSVVKYNLGMM